MDFLNFKSLFKLLIGVALFSLIMSCIYYLCGGDDFRWMYRMTFIWFGGLIALCVLYVVVYEKITGRIL